MSLSFDLISDLNLSQWCTEPDWQNLPTSLFCVVVGNVDRDINDTAAFLKKLCDVYQAVFYIDGPMEHEQNLRDLGQSYKQLEKKLARIPGVTHLQNSVIVINGVALIGTNGWHDFGFNPNLPRETMRERYRCHYDLDDPALDQIEDFADTDRRYLGYSTRKLQTYYDIKKIVVVTSAVPKFQLVQHDLTLMDNDNYVLYGNDMVDEVLSNDLSDKLSTWCFGNYAGSVDCYHHGVRFLNNCRGDSTGRYRSVYYPLRVTVET